jgi:hypothetical protein
MKQIMAGGFSQAVAAAAPDQDKRSSAARGSPGRKSVFLGTLLGLALAPGFLLRADDRAVERSAANPPATVERLARDFEMPPTDSRPRAYWFWLEKNITETGLTRDLEAMKRIGLKGFNICDLQGGAGEVTPLSAPWCKAVEHTARECDRLGLSLGMSSSAGWVAGGPWITPALSMQDIVWRHCFVKGPIEGEIQLPQPLSNRGYYRDVAVLAFPTLPGDAVPVSALDPKTQSDPPDLNWSAALDDDPETSMTIPVPSKGPTNVSLVLEFKEPVSVRSLILGIRPVAQDRFTGMLKVNSCTSEDGKAWRPFVNVLRWRPKDDANRDELCGGASEVKARFLKVEFPFPAGSVPLTLYDLNFQAARLKDNYVKAARMRTQPQICMPSPQVVAEADRIDPGRILDLTAQLTPDGKLRCRLPEGEWTLIRLGCTSNGNEVHGGGGLECDKMSADAVEYHFKSGLAGRMLDFLGPLAGRVFKRLAVDSWEAGCQTWTQGFPAEFQRRRGYDSRKWLVALTGRIVGDVDRTERFLWDYRRTVADLIAENFYGKLRELCSAKGIELESEAPGIGIPIISDEVECLGRVDIPQGEFWLSGPPDPVQGWKGGQDNTREAAAAAHVYGKAVASSEAFTAFGHHDGWTQYPFTLKPVGDRQFCNGINEFVFHRYVHQPDERSPGMSLGQFGLNFDRHLTWWEEGRAWVDYLTRCQYMLRQGRFVADVCYYYGEGAPATAWYYVPGALDPRQRMRPVLPRGYDYDACDHAIFLAMSVVDGQVALPGGMRYRYLALPDDAQLTPPALAKVRELVLAGATVIGPRPSRSPSLADFPQADRRIRELADALWPQADGPGERRVGKGRVITGKPFEKVFDEDGLPPDFVARMRAEDGETCYIHRTLPEGELYFISNQRDRAEEPVLRFRVSGRVPERWDPAAGSRSEILMRHDDGRCTELALRLEPFDSAFIFFRGPTPKQGAVVNLLKEGRRVRGVAEPETAQAGPVSAVRGTGDERGELIAWESGEYEVTFDDGRTTEITVQGLPAPETVPEGWTVRFQKARGAPEAITFDRLVSWTKRSEDGIRHFSGTATYVKGINVSTDRLAEGRRVYLDLGDVRHVAEVIVNDKPQGVLWKPPFRVDITEASLPGANKVEVRVTNVWKNRLVGDSKLPPVSRLTWTSYPFHKPDAPLLDSGLLGPVRVLSSQSEPLRN